MYSTSCGTISASHKSLTKRDRRRVSIGRLQRGKQWSIVTAPLSSTDNAGGQYPQRRADNPHDHPAEPPAALVRAVAHGDLAATVAARTCSFSSPICSRRKAMLHKLAVIALALGLAAPGLLLAAKPVNINTADAKTIAKSLDGIGETRAE